MQPSDIALANKLAHEVLGRTLDEMPPQTRKLLVLIQEMAKDMAGQQGCQSAEVRFTRRDIRGYTNWSDSQLKHHCLRLAEMEYLLVHGGSRGHLLQYQLLWDGGSGEENHLCGLLNVDETAENNEGSERKFGSEEGKSALSSGQVRGKFGQEKSTSGQSAQGLRPEAVRAEGKAVIKGKAKTVLPPSPEIQGGNINGTAG